MTFSRKTVGLSLRLAACLSLAAVLEGCGTTPTASPPSAQTAPTPVDQEGRLRAGELVTIAYSDISPAPQPFQSRIREDGKIMLLLNQEFVAAGKTVAELEKAIHDWYVPKYFVNLTATVRVEDRYFYVDGQVKGSSRLEYRGHITVLGAIAAAGGFTDFAKPSAVKIIRANGKIEIVNCRKARNDSRLDLPIYPGDRIIVPRRFW